MSTKDIECLLLVEHRRVEIFDGFLQMGYHEFQLLNSPFETSLFARLWREKSGDAAAVLEALRGKGVTLIVVNWSEAVRLRDTYGLDPEINPANVEYSCEKGGYKTLGVMTRRMSRDKFAPVLIECMLEKT